MFLTRCSCLLADTHSVAVFNAWAPTNQAVGGEFLTSTQGQRPASAFGSLSHSCYHMFVFLDDGRQTVETEMQ